VDGEKIVPVEIESGKTISNSNLIISNIGINLPLRLKNKAMWFAAVISPCEPAQAHLSVGGN
jgi:hypothetical protein